jgi:hypothetical protein
MYIILFSAVGIFLGVVIWQLAVLLSEIQDKDRKYEAATAYAQKVGKPLLVAGGPWGTYRIRRWLNMPAHGSGDVCLDIDCCTFLGHPCGVVADVTQVPFVDKSFGAAFVSHLLEHLPTVDDAKNALAELNRVAEVVFIAYPSRQSIGAWLKREHHLWIWQKGSVTYIEQRGNTGGKSMEEHPSQFSQGNTFIAEDIVLRVGSGRREAKHD